MLNRKKVTITLDSETIDILEKRRTKIGIPISQSLERACLKVYGEDFNAK